MRWLALAVALGAAPSAMAEGVKVAVAKVRGRPASKPDALERGIREGIKAAGATAIGSTSLLNAAQKVGVKQDSAEGARAAGADYLVRARLSRNDKKKKTTATVELLRSSDGVVVDTVTKVYGGKAAAGTGKTIGKELGARAVALGRVDDAKPPPLERFTPIAPPPPPPSVAVEEDDEPKAEVRAEVKTEARASGEDAILRFALGGGTQVASAYTVVVGGASTGLAYKLSPLFLVDLNARVRIPPTGLFIGVGADFCRVRYRLETDPPVSPEEPGGWFFSVGGTVGYDIGIDLGEGLALSIAPVIAFSYDALTVTKQEPRAILLSWGIVDGQAGVEIGLELFDALAIDAVARFGYIFAYSERPDRTGDGGRGFDITVGGRIRYWFIPAIGVYLDALYEYQRIGLKDMGSRQRFLEDPELVDATIFSADLEISLGAMLAI